MDTRYNIYVKEHLESILLEISNEHFPSYNLHFAFIWEWYIKGKLCKLVVTPHAHDHRHFTMPNDVIDKIVDALKNYEGEQDILSAAQQIARSQKQIIILLDVQTLVKNISEKLK